MNQFEHFLSQLFRSDEVLFGLADVLLALVVSTILCLMLGYVYRRTHRGTSYSQSFLVTLFLMGITTAVVMMVIGSNIARAFSLVGALSIIRFRTAVKDPRDTAFLFVAMISGMACGTQFYMPAIVLVVYACVLILVLYHMDYGIKQRLDSVVRVTFNESAGGREAIESELQAGFREAKLINRVLDFDEDQVTHVYLVRPSRKTDVQAVEERLRQVSGVTGLAVYETDQHAPI